MTVLNLFDASNYQTMDTFNAWLARTSGAVIKASEGRTGHDASHDQFAARVRSVGKLKGDYHFAHPELNAPGAEVATFLAAAKLVAGETSWLDFEPYAPGGGFKYDPRLWPDWIIGFKHEFARQCGFALSGIYLNHDCANQLISHCSPAQAGEIHGLHWWAADYNGRTTTLHGWPTATAQQWTDHPVDQDWWNGDAASFKAAGRPGAVITRPPSVHPRVPVPVAPGPHYGYPLPNGYYFGVNDGTKYSVSGSVARSFNGRPGSWWIQQFAAQLARRGWKIGAYLGPAGNNGVFGPRYASLVVAYEKNRHGKAGGVDAGRIGPAVWHDAFFNAVS